MKCDYVNINSVLQSVGKRLAPPCFIRDGEYDDTIAKLSIFFLMKAKRVNPLWCPVNVVFCCQRQEVENKNETATRTTLVGAELFSLCICLKKERKDWRYKARQTSSSLTLWEVSPSSKVGIFFTSASILVSSHLFCLALEEIIQYLAALNFISKFNYQHTFYTCLSKLLLKTLC